MNTEKIQPIQILFLIVSLILISCSNDSGNPSSYSPFDEMPVVTGLFFTSEESPEVLAVWGNPSGRSFCKPSIGDYTNIGFAIPEQNVVKVWVVPARLPQQESKEVLNEMNAQFEVLNRLSVNTLLNEVMNVGSYGLEYHFTDSQGGLLPEGFYRIYVQSGDWLKWCDVLNFRNESNYYKVIVNQIYDNLTYIGRPQ